MQDKEKLKKMALVCKEQCPVCTRARKKGKGILYTLVKFESKFCPYCKAYEQVYKKPAFR